VAREGFEETEHTADWALRVRGADLAGLCVQAAIGMLKLSGAVAGRASRKVVKIDIKGRDVEEILVRFLEEVLYQLEMHASVPVEYHISAEAETHLMGTVVCAPLATLDKAIKAVTYHDLQIVRSPAGLEATVVFDV
jgi:SHS2 domain-containing protein